MKKISEREYKYQAVVKELVKRYIMRKQQRDMNAGVTEDDLNEIKQDISGLRFELLEILKKNDFKVDVLNQNRSGKRKRGKLNLEKAMAKNIFDNDPSTNDVNKRLNNIFDTMNLNSGTPTSGNEGSMNFHKQSKRSTLSQPVGDSKSADVILKEVHETMSASGSHKIKSKFVQIEQNKSSSGSHHSSPAMYRIALRLKRLTDMRLKKTNSESTMSRENTVSAGSSSRGGAQPVEEDEQKKAPVAKPEVDETVSRPPNSAASNKEREIPIEGRAEFKFESSIDATSPPPSSGFGTFYFTIYLS